MNSFLFLENWDLMWINRALVFAVCVFILKRSKTCTCSWWSFSWWSLHELHEGISFRVNTHLSSTGFYTMSSGIRIPFHSEFAEQGNLYLLVAFFFLVIFYMRHMMVLHFGMIHISINWLLHDEQWNMNIFLQHLMSRGCNQHIQSCTNEDTEWCWWYHDWSSWRTCYFIEVDMVILLKHWSWALVFPFLKLFALQSCRMEHLLSWLRHMMP